MGSTQYLGGVYGSGAVASSAPQDSVSYWDGDGVSGQTFGQNQDLPSSEPIFTKAANWSAFRSFRPDARALGTPSGHLQDHPEGQGSRLQSLRRLRGRSRQRRRPECRREQGSEAARAPASKARRCRISCASSAASECTPAICPDIPLRTVASGCRSSWRRISSTPSPSALLSRSRTSVASLASVPQLALPGLGIASSCTRRGIHDHHHSTQRHGRADRADRGAGRGVGLEAQVSRGASRVIVGVVGPEELVREERFAAMPGVEADRPDQEALQARLLRIPRRGFHGRNLRRQHRVRIRRLP